MKLLLPLLFAMFLLAGCTSSEEQAFKRARMTDTVVAWEDFLRDFLYVVSRKNRRAFMLLFN